MLDQITPLILTYNEAPNLERTLKPLQRDNRIVAIDSYSTDTTLEILNIILELKLFSENFYPLPTNVILV